MQKFLGKHCWSDENGFVSFLDQSLLVLWTGRLVVLGLLECQKARSTNPQGRPIALNHEYLQARGNHSGSARFDHYGGSNCPATWPVRSTDLRSAKSVTKVIRAVL